MIRPLAETTIAARFGAKAVNLRRVEEAGIPVPLTYVLERAALSAFLETTGMGAAVGSYLAGEPVDASYEALCAQIRATELGADLVDAIEATTSVLLASSPSGIAVRSSAVSEDSEAASFAGVFESVVGLHTSHQVIAAIKEVWCSLWSPRAVRYARKLGLAPGADEMALMLQAVVPASFAGVMYTAELRTGDPGVLEIHDVEGLSIDLMSGSGHGASFEIDWAAETVQHSCASRQTERHVVTKSGLEAISLEAPEPLSAAALSDLIATAKALDLSFGRRLDIEWALDASGVQVVQARPITALPEFFPVELSEEEQLRDWKPLHFNVSMRFDDSANLNTPLYDDRDEMELWFRHHTHDITLTGPIFDVKDVLGHRYGVELAHPTFITYFDEHGWDGLEPWLRDNEPDYYARWSQHDQELQQIASLADAAIRETTTAEELLPRWLDVRDRGADCISFGWSAPQCMGWMFEGLLTIFMGQAKLDVVAPDLLAGTDTSHSFRFSRALQELARGMDEPEVVDVLCSAPIDEILPRLTREQPSCRFLRDLDALCWDYGKPILAWASRPPFWRTAQSDFYPLLVSIRSIRGGTALDVEEVQQRSLEESNAYRALVAARVAEAGASVEGFQWIVDRARVWTQALNDRHADRIAMNWERELAWILGTRLCDEHIIERPEQVLALGVGDLRMLFKLPLDDRRTLTRERWLQYEHFLRLTPPPTLGRSAPQPQSAPEPVTAAGSMNLFQGRGLSGERITGRARPVQDLCDVEWLDSISSDDILVLLEEHAFFYADWHSLLTTVRGVASVGRPSHHLSQVARECRVTVVGYLEGDLGSISDGAPCELDPTAGTFRLLTRDTG